MAKRWRYLKYLVIPFGLLLIYILIFYFLDFYADGYIANWFENNFMLTYESVSDSGMTILVHSINWSAFKQLLVLILMIILLIGSVSYIYIIDHRQRVIKEECTHLYAEQLAKYILNGETLPAEVPKGTEDMFLKISEIKTKDIEKEQLLNAETKRKDDLVTYLAHDLRTPLTSVIGYLTVLSEAPELPLSIQQQYIDIAIKKSERMEQLITEMLEITRYNITQLELEYQQVDLSKMLEQIAYEFKPIMSDKNLTFEFDIDQNVIMTCDVDKMERIIDNLLRNAINYSYADSPIRLHLRDEGEEALLSVENAGRTIPKEKLERLFEQFYKADSSRNSSNGGSGLGLSIAKQLVEAHGGSIEASSDDETICFNIRLPKKMS